MKKFIILLAIITVAFASELIPLERVEGVANRFILQRYGQYRLNDVVTYYGLDEQPSAYAMIYRNIENEPLTIVMGARYTISPVNEIA